MMSTAAHDSEWLTEDCYKHYKPCLSVAGARGLIRPQTIVSTYETHSGTGCAAEYWFIAANSEYCFHVLSGL